MKIWKVAFSELDNFRLRAQHHEWHTLAGYFRNNKKWLGWEKPEYAFAFYMVHELVVGELIARGFNHNTPVERPETTVEQVPYPYTEEDVEADRWLLICRWEGVYKGRDPQWYPLYKPLLEKYRSQGGCKHDGPVDKKKGMEVCAMCKKAYRKNKYGSWRDVPPDGSLKYRHHRTAPYVPTLDLRVINALQDPENNQQGT